MIALFGAGNMGFAMLSRWRAQGFDVCVFDPNPSDAVLDLHKSDSFALNPDRLDGEADAVVFAVKPDQLLSVVEAARVFLSPHSLLISIAAGKPLAQILEASGDPHLGVVRAMPNMPAQIGKGFVAFYAHPNCSAGQTQLAEKLMAALGQTSQIADEGLMDAITVLSGCGPAYLFYLAELLTEAGVHIGLDQDWTKEAVIATFAGAIAMLESNSDAAALRKQVTSPHGVTEAGFAQLLQNDRLRQIFLDAFAAAHRRALELGEG